MKVIVDRHIPYIEGMLEPYATVVYAACEEFTPALVRDADALVIRTRLRCGRELLEGSRVQFVATASIGYDHIDVAWCRDHGIAVANAPGCNAPGVAQYVIEALRYCGHTRGTLGVVGVGHVGSIVARWARELGMEVLECDPPRFEKEGPEGFVSLDEVARRADVVTFHTPLTREGAHPTWHLADKEFFKKLRRKPLIINAARGGVVDEEAMMASQNIDGFVIDCWEGEPRLNPRTLERAILATPHIAGYSREGKLRATQMSVAALLEHFKIESTLEPPVPVPQSLAEVAPYDIEADSRRLREHPETFEAQRNYYDFRPEFR